MHHSRLDLSAKAVLVLGLALCLGALACSHGRFDPMHRGNAFDDSLKRFSRLIRWSQFDQASSYVDPELRASFLRQAAALDQVRFTDYEVLDVEVDDGFRSATVNVLYRAYNLSSMIEQSIAVRQEWFRNNESGGWRVRPELAELPRAFGTR